MGVDGDRSCKQALLNAAAACALICMPLAAWSQVPPSAESVKAVYLYKFIPYVEWPAASFTSESDPLVLCVIGSDPVASLADDAVRGQTVGRRPIVVRHLAYAQRESTCHMMYIAGARDEAVAAAVDAGRGRPVLTITDFASEGKAQPIIRFVMQDNRVRFEVDQRAAADSGLIISSKLLALSVKR